MTAIVLFFLLGYLIEAVTVGIAAFAIFGQRLAQFNHWKGIAIFIPLFAVLQIWYIPFLVPLDISVKVGNREVVEFFHLAEGYVSLNEMLDLGMSDVIASFFQSVIAYFAGFYVFGKRNLTSRSS